MTSVFQIEVGNPSVIEGASGHASDLSEAIEMLYSMETPDAKLNWGGQWLNINYKYDASVIVPDVIELLERCVAGKDGRLRVCFGSNTFRVDWDVNFRGDLVSVISLWECVSGASVAILNAVGQLAIGRERFMGEWLKLLGRIVVDLESTPITLLDDDLLVRARRLLSKRVR